MAAAVLTPTEQALVLDWLLDGLSDAEVVERLESECGKTCTRENIRGNYRAKHREAIQAAEQAAYEAVCESGYGRRSQRVACLARKAHKLDDALDKSSPAGWTINGTNFLKELRDTLAAIAKECGQEAPTKLDLKGSVGVNVVQFGPDDHGAGNHGSFDLPPAESGAGEDDPAGD